MMTTVIMERGRESDCMKWFAMLLWMLLGFIFEDWLLKRKHYGMIYIVGYLFGIVAMIVMNSR